jgi:CBS domain containing-hemolysin-like protein
MYPAIWVLNASANMVLRVAGLSGAGGHDTHYSNDELKLILRTNTSTTGEKSSPTTSATSWRSRSSSPSTGGVRPDAPD